MLYKFIMKTTHRTVIVSTNINVNNVNASFSLTITYES